MPSPRVSVTAGTTLDTAASAVRMATLNAVAGLDGLAAVEPAEVDEIGSDDPASVGLAAGAEVVLVAEVAGDGNGVRIALRLLSAADNRVQWARTFQAPTGDLELIVESVEVHVAEAFPHHRPRRATPLPNVRGEDFRSYLTARRLLDSPTRETPFSDLLQEFHRIRTSSPGLLAAYQEEAEVANALYRETHDRAYLERAFAVVRDGQRIAPEDPRILRAAFRVALTAEDDAEIARVIDALEAVAPTHPDVVKYRGWLARRQGRDEDALRFARAAVEMSPSWQNLVSLARLEYRSGNNEAAKAQLQRVHGVFPGCKSALSLAAEIALLEDPARAEELLVTLCELAPLSRNLTNLGVARLLLHRFEDAATAFEQALSAAPVNPYATINLADAYLLSGRRDEGAGLYRRTLQLLPSTDEEATVDEKVMRAICLAQLGQSRDAVSTLQAAQRDPGNKAPSELDYHAALVLTLVGDLNAASVHAVRALDGGLDSRWFDLPFFDPLRETIDLSSADRPRSR